MIKKLLLLFLIGTTLCTRYECFDVDACIKCNDLDGKCAECRLGYSLDGDNNCQVNSGNKENCDIYDSEGKCVICSYSYHVKEDGSCEADDTSGCEENNDIKTNCLHCSSSKCLFCAKGYYPNEAGECKANAKCDENCIDCKSDGCSLCDPYKSLAYLTQDKKCSSCSDFCYKCSKDGVCLANVPIDDDYKWEPLGACADSIKNICATGACSTSNTSYCAACAEGYSITTINGENSCFKLGTCDSSVSNICQENGCFIDNKKSCLYCKDGYAWNSTLSRENKPTETMECIKLVACTNPKFAKGCLPNKCYETNEHCYQCDYDEGYEHVYLDDPQGECKKLTQCDSSVARTCEENGCLESDNKICGKCIDGYAHGKNNKCVPMGDHDEDGAAGFFKFSLFLLILFLI